MASTDDVIDDVEGMGIRKVYLPHNITVGLYHILSHFTSRKFSPVTRHNARGQRSLLEACSRRSLTGDKAITAQGVTILPGH